MVAMEAAHGRGRPFQVVLLDLPMPEMEGFAVAEKIKNDPIYHSATIMMLSSVGYLGDAARCREFGISAYLVKPIRQSELLDGIRIALGRKPVNTLVARHSLHESKRHLHILFAEDNAVNQAVVVRILEKVAIG